MRKNNQKRNANKNHFNFFYLLLKDPLGLLVMNGRKEVIFRKAHQAF